MAPTNAAASPTAASCGPARQAVVRLSAAKLEEDDADAPPDDAALRTSGAVDEDDADERGGDGGGTACPVAADAAGIALFGGAAVDAEGPGDSERALLAGDAARKRRLALAASARASAGLSGRHDDEKPWWRS